MYSSILENFANNNMKTRKTTSVMPAQAGIHKLLILNANKVAGFRPAPE